MDLIVIQSLLQVASLPQIDTSSGTACRDLNDPCEHHTRPQRMVCHVDQDKADFFMRLQMPKLCLDLGSCDYELFTCYIRMSYYNKEKSHFAEFQSPWCRPRYSFQFVYLRTFFFFYFLSIVAKGKNILHDFGKFHYSKSSHKWPMFIKIPSICLYMI